MIRKNQLHSRYLGILGFLPRGLMPHSWSGLVLNMLCCERPDGYLWRTISAEPMYYAMQCWDLKGSCLMKVGLAPP